MNSKVKKPIKHFIDHESLRMFREVFWEKCKLKGVSIEDLVDRTGLELTQVKRIVFGTQNTSLSNVIAVIRAAGFQPSEIFNFKISIPNYPPLRSELGYNTNEKILGAKEALDKAIKSGMLAVGKRMSVSEITDFINKTQSGVFKSSQFSPPLLKMFQAKNIKREKNSENVFEYYLSKK